MIIGITNLPGSGSNSFGDFLVKNYGFTWLSYSDLLRDELRKQGEEITRKAMQDIANEIREKYRAGELSKRLIAKTQPGKNYVFGTIRNPAEVLELKKHGDAFLVSIEAPFEQRFERVLKRDRESDPKTIEEMKALDEKECGKGQEKSGMWIADCMKMADFTIVNDGSFEEFKYKVVKLMEEIKQKT